MISVNISGKDYPCYQTMGAFLRFSRAQGSIAAVEAGDVTAQITWMWCLTASACNAEGVEFGLGLEDFADRLTPAAFKAWAESLLETVTDSGEQPKKK